MMEMVGGPPSGMEVRYLLLLWWNRCDAIPRIVSVDTTVRTHQWTEKKDGDD
jgi:hypothetical protein